MIRPRRRKAAASAELLAIMTGVVATILMVLGWSLFEFDAALLVYAQALVLSLTLVVYRLVIWAERPPTAAIFSRAKASLLTSEGAGGRVLHVLKRCGDYFALNRFVWKRSKRRWGTHWPIMIGCLMAMAVVLPLILGWVWFETPPDDLHSYKVMVLGQHVRTVPVDGIEAFIAFHGLVWAAIPVVIGTGIGLWRRLTDRGDQATQTFGHDLAPLLILMGIALTGLLMTFSYTFVEGNLHAPIALIHMLLVVATLIWIPFSKLIHIPQRLLKLAHFVYEHESDAGEQAVCQRCGETFASQIQVDDLIEVQQRLGYRYELEANSPVEHYQSVCPQCRRSMLVLSQSRRWQR